MLRINLLLLAALIGCALALVTSQHQARKLYVELQKEQDLAKALEVEWDQLQQKLATKLGMRVPPPSRVQVVPARAKEGGR
jgi:cell division protein FtsL